MNIDRKIAKREQENMHTNVKHSTLGPYDQTGTPDDYPTTLELTSLLNTGVEEALLCLTPEQLQELEQSVYKMENVEKTSPKRKRAKKATDQTRKKKAGGGQYLNLPASTPEVEYKSGVTFMVFTYSTRGHLQEYKIVIDGVESIPLESIPQKFKDENCVYPRAMCSRSEYKGNRWEYETKVNELSWKLCWLNPSVLCGKRGLIQRAVDSYRNKRSESRSRRVIRQERVSSGVIPRTRADPDTGEGGKTISMEWMERGKISRIKLAADIDAVDVATLEPEFKTRNCLHINAVSRSNMEQTQQYQHEYQTNELGWKLAALNTEKLDGKRKMILKAVETYKALANMKTKEGVEKQNEDSHMEHFRGSYSLPRGETSEELRSMVEKTLQQAMEDGFDVDFARDLDDATILAVLQHAQEKLNKEDDV
ncbi:MAG: uncharacterized protein A8A55_2082 [Amphiamblys sp. WSBS2006]|nr:MAG: uncharacterized protein A8A55_2082 [Amphiamblys sp. WSBS2006]